ncbi:o-methyltransferase [Lucifera butyrica]|uniref:tRNA 5-hydroxyuridine methyltransferase n=1 Tax=Lucifera butyrica TaxID=1351585 RepID=A0A498R4E9_9FIRM|nr:O-methyltransferase [Lucifera butyrica]VBB06019.1 o-methyltransferase [Lucifera butyrica]
MSDVTAILENMQEYARQFRVPILSAEGVSLLSQAIQIHRPQSILEIGTAIGYSAIIMAGHASPGARILTIEQDEARLMTARHFIQQAGMEAMITVVPGDAGNVLPELTGRFDFVFIDAAKGQYLNYLRQIMDRLLPGAVIIADNVLFRGMVGKADPPRRYRTIVKRLEQYLTFVTEDRRFQTTVYSRGDGIAISRFQGDIAHE